jgi:hypothetical protein
MLVFTPGVVWVLFWRQYMVITVHRCVSTTTTSLRQWAKPTTAAYLALVKSTSWLPRANGVSVTYNVGVWRIPLRKIYSFARCRSFSSKWLIYIPHRRMDNLGGLLIISKTSFL